MSDIFKSGWRPFIGWSCGVLLLAFYVPQFALAAYLWLGMCLQTHTLLPYPLPADNINNLVYAILGLGTLRTFEKTRRKTNGKT
ncbi:hypothetical protein [Nitrospira sp. BLG_2]|uniref:hypothetical protein n=1 Tax=Nitrospira sp. BLG_2 TaxID=3397507 RepID=UPI003B9D254F